PWIHTSTGHNPDGPGSPWGVYTTARTPPTWRSVSAATSAPSPPSATMASIPARASSGVSSWSGGASADAIVASSSWIAGCSGIAGWCHRAHRRSAAEGELPSPRAAPADEAAVDLGERGATGQCHRALDPGSQQSQHVVDAGLPGGTEPVQVGPPDRAGVGAEGDCLHDVAAAPHPAVHDDRRPALHRLGHGLDQLDRRRGVVELAAAVVRQGD